jgi:hypothetical protein
VPEPDPVVELDVSEFDPVVVLDVPEPDPDETAEFDVVPGSIVPLLPQLVLPTTSPAAVRKTKLVALCTVL